MIPLPIVRVIAACLMGLGILFTIAFLLGSSWVDTDSEAVAIIVGVLGASLKDVAAAFAASVKPKED